MRKFKLLKDLPWMKAGTICFTDRSINIDIGFDNVYIFIEPSIYSEWFEEIKEEPKKTVRRWLWDYKPVNVHKRESYSDSNYMLNDVWLTESEAEKDFHPNYFYKKTKFKGQEVWQDFEEWEAVK